MSLTSWKKYGNIDRYEKTNYISVDSFVTNYFTIRKQIVGDIDISGNLLVENHLIVYNDSSFSANVVIDGNLMVHKDVIVDKNTFLLKKTFFETSEELFLYGDSGYLGINTTSPSYILDICGNVSNMFNVQSSTNEVLSVLGQNVDGKGIVATSNNSNAKIEFYLNNKIGEEESSYDALIKCKDNGVMIIDSSKNIQLLAKVVVSDNEYSDAIRNNSKITVYADESNGIYAENIYDNSVAQQYNGITMQTNDSSSVIFTNFVTNQSNGFAIGGGAFPEDMTRSMGTIGLLDNSSNYIASQTIVSGTSSIKYKSTVGINTYSPHIDDYVLHVNGPVCFTNGEITDIANPSMKINKMYFSKTDANYGIAFGGPYYIDVSNYSQQILYTTDGGKIWNAYDFLTEVFFSPSSAIINMNTAFLYDSSYMFLFGDNGSGYYTVDEGITWYSNNFNNTGNDAISSYSYSIGNNASRIIVLFKNTDGSGNDAIHPSDSEYVLWYYDAIIDNSGSDTAYIYYNQSFTDGSNINITKNRTTAIDVSGGCIDGYGDYFYIAGTGIYKYKSNNNDNIVEKNNDSHNEVNSVYHAICVYNDDYVVAVGENILSYTTTGGDNWIDIDTFSYTLRSVSIYDLSNAIAVGDDGALIYTIDGVTWNDIPSSIKNMYGNGGLLDGKLNDVFIFNKNEFIVSKIIDNGNYTTYSANATTGSSTILYNFLPELLNHKNNNVFDICGNMSIYGNINVYGTNIDSTENNFLLLNNNVETIYFGGDANHIQIGDTNGTTWIRNSLDVSGHECISGNLLVYGDTSMNGNLTVGNKSTFDEEAKFKSTIVVKGTSTFEDYGVFYSDVDICGNLLVYGDTSMNGNLTVVNKSTFDEEAKFKSNVIVKGDLTIEGNLTYSGSTGGGGSGTGVDSSGNLTVSNILTVEGTSYLQNVIVGGNIIFTGDNISIDPNSNTSNYVTYNSNGDLDISGNIHLNGDISGNGNLYVSQVSTLYGDVHAKSKITIDGEAKLKGLTKLEGNVTMTGSENTLSVDGMSYFYNDVDVSGNLDVAGDVYFSGSWNSSDYRIKTNVVSLENTDFSVDDLKPIHYYNTLNHSEQFGFIAHEIGEQFPFLVSGEKDGEDIQSVNYISLIGLLVHEIQQLKKRVSELER